MLPTDVTQSDQTVTDLGQTGAMLLAELDDAREAEKAAKARVELVRAAIESLLTEAGATEALVNGQPAITWRPVVSRRFNEARARRYLTPEQIEDCYVESESRPFRRAQ